MVKIKNDLYIHLIFIYCKTLIDKRTITYKINKLLLSKQLMYLVFYNCNTSYTCLQRRQPFMNLFYILKYSSFFYISAKVK